MGERQMSKSIHTGWGCDVRIDHGCCEPIQEYYKHSGDSGISNFPAYFYQYWFMLHRFLEAVRATLPTMQDSAIERALSTHSSHTTRSVLRAFSTFFSRISRLASIVQVLSVPIAPACSPTICHTTLVKALPPALDHSRDCSTSTHLGKPHHLFSPCSLPISSIFSVTAL